jgi:hypothetical protein
VALWEFLKKYGLDRVSLEEARQSTSREEELATLRLLDAPSAGGLVPVVPDKLVLPTRSTPGPSCFGPKCSLGSTRLGSASPTTTVRSSRGF